MDNLIEMQTYLEDAIKKEGSIDVIKELLKKYQTYEPNTPLALYEKLKHDEKYSGYIDYETNYIVSTNPNYAINQSLLQTNVSVRKVNGLFWATVIISAASLFASISSVIVQSRQFELQRQQLLQKPVPIKVEIPQPLKVTVQSNEDTIKVKSAK